MDTGLKKIIDCASNLIGLRASAMRTENDLKKRLDEYLSPHEAAGQMARHLKISPQHLSDIRHGRRAISDAVAEKLEKMS